MVKNYISESLDKNARVPLILGIWGGKGQGKSFQTELAFKKMGCDPGSPRHKEKGSKSYGAHLGSVSHGLMVPWQPLRPIQSPHCLFYRVGCMVGGLYVGCFILLIAQHAQTLAQAGIHRGSRVVASCIQDAE